PLTALTGPPRCSTGWSTSVGSSRMSRCSTSLSEQTVPSAAPTSPTTGRQMLTSAGRQGASALSSGVRDAAHWHRRRWLHAIPGQQAGLRGLFVEAAVLHLLSRDAKCVSWQRREDFSCQAAAGYQFADRRRAGEAVTNRPHRWPVRDDRR